MAEIKFRNRGVKEITLTRQYNTANSYTANKDDVRFNDSANEFSDYCFQITCGVWQNDKIKILSIPDKGKLFYLTNPGSANLIYANVIVGQEFLVRDLIDNKILKFNGEGFANNSYAGTYLTSFKIERFCGANSNNIITTIRLNMIDVEISVPVKTQVLVPQTCQARGEGPTNYDVWCTGSVDFSFSDKIATPYGFIKMTFNGGTYELGISKQNGGALLVNDVFPVTQMLTATLDAAGINSPSSYPYGSPSNPTGAEYIFQYSLNGFDDWSSFSVLVKNG